MKHKKMAGYDIYYFANSTNIPYTGIISLLGEYTVCEEWNPHTGKIKKTTVEYTIMNEETYTCFEMSLDSAASVFIVCR